MDQNLLMQILQTMQGGGMNRGMNAQPGMSPMPQQATLSQTPLGAQNFGGAPKMALQGQASPPPPAGPPGGGMDQFQKAKMQMMMQQQQPAGNPFANPYMKGPDWGNGLSQMFQQLGMNKKMKGLGL